MNGVHKNCERRSQNCERRSQFQIVNGSARHPRGHVVPADQRAEHLYQVDKIHRDEELYIWQHLTSLVKNRASSVNFPSEGDGTDKTRNSGDSTLTEPKIVNPQS